MGLLSFLKRSPEKKQQKEAEKALKEATKDMTKDQLESLALQAEVMKNAARENAEILNYSDTVTAVNDLAEMTKHKHIARIAYMKTHQQTGKSLSSYDAATSKVYRAA